ncbi:MAG: polyprenyl synthetase family protein [Bacteroidota bacterium]
MQAVKRHQEEFLAYLSQYDFNKKPANLYQPINYILHLGGKRLRPVLVLLAADAFGATAQKALPASLAIEVFHNFSLVHDDIMDDAPLRRGHLTVHEKWDTNTAILSGDAMLINCYQLLESYPATTYQQLTSLFSKTAIEVCEGQQYDVDFEEQENVSIEEYLKMIEYKTAVLVAAALQMGAIIAETNLENQKLIYEFGKLLGIAFQLQDDYLDAFGDPKSFGKKVGGDISENKKTYLYIKSLELADQKIADQLRHLYTIQPKNDNSKINTVKNIFMESGAAKATQQAIENYTEAAFKKLHQLDIDQKHKEKFQAFGEWLMKREV